MPVGDAIRFLGVGNPLLDIMVMADDAIYEKYNLKKDDSILTEEKHMSIYDDLKNYEITCAAGGAALNTIKMIQWLSRSPGVCTFIGCISDDAYGKILIGDCRKLGLNTAFQMCNKANTGKVAVLIKDNNRSMVTYLGAAQNLSLSHFEDPAVWDEVIKAEVYYTTGYLICSCYEGQLKVAKHSLENGKMFCFNFSAEYVLEHLSAQVDEMISYASIIIANRTEALAYAKAHSMEDNTLHSIARQIAKNPFSDKINRKRIVIITSDENPITVAVSTDELVHEYLITQIPNDQIVDTNGAGDAFAAGFIYKFANTRCLDSSIKEAIKAASYIVCKSGFTLGPIESYL